MKTTKKLVLVLAIVVAGVMNQAKAQMMIGGGLNLGFPAGGLTGMSMGFGFGVDGRYMLSDKMSAGLTIDMVGFSGSGGVKANCTPIMLRGDYYMGDDQTGLYGGLGLGFGSTKVSVTVPILGKVEAKGSGFAYGLRAGYLIPMGDKLKIDLNASYNSISATGGSISYLGIHGGILYTLGN